MASSQFTDISTYVVDTGATSAGALAQAVIMQEVRRQAQKRLVWQNLVRTQLVAPGARGKSFAMPVIGDATASTKSAGHSVTLQDNTDSSVTITVDQHKESSNIIEDIANIQSNQDVRDYYVKRSLYAINDAIDQYMAGLACTASTGFNREDTAAAGIVAEADILKALANLDSDKCPTDEGEDMFGVVSATAKSDILAIARFTEINKIGVQDKIVKGALGTIHGFQLMMSQNTASTLFSGDSPEEAENYNFFFHREAMGLVSQIMPRVQLSYQQAYLGWLLTVDSVYGGAVLNSTWGEIIDE